jgi:hypothetical protein
VAGELRLTLEAVDRSDLGEQLRSGQRSAAGQLEQRGRCLCGPPLELAVKLCDRARERATAADEFARDPDLQLLLPTTEPASHTLKLHWPVERFRRHGKGRVELVQMPAQPLLGATALVDQIITVIDQQLQITKDPLTRPWPAQIRLTERRAGDRERVDPVRLAASPTRAPLRHRQLRRYTHQFLTEPGKLSFQPARQLPAVLQRP